MRMDEQARQERDPVAIQLELLEIDRQILERQPVLEKKHKAFQESKAEYEVEKLRYRRPGMNNCEIAAALYCSEGWVRLTRKRLVRKIAEGIGIL